MKTLLWHLPFFRDPFCLFVNKQKGCVLQTIPWHSLLHYSFTSFLKSVWMCCHVPVVEGLLNLIRKENSNFSQAFSQKSAKRGSSLTELFGRFCPKKQWFRSLLGLGCTFFQQHSWSSVFEQVFFVHALVRWCVPTYCTGSSAILRVLGRVLVVTHQILKIKMETKSLWVCE